jgi:hypothetical protein
MPRRQQVLKNIDSRLLRLDHRSRNRIVELTAQGALTLAYGILNAPEPLRGLIKKTRTRFPLTRSAGIILEGGISRLIVQPLSEKAHDTGSKPILTSIACRTPVISQVGP